MVECKQAPVAEVDGMIQCTDQASHFSLNYQASNMSRTNFVDQISAFPSLSDFNVTAPVTKVRAGEGRRRLP